MKRVGEDNDGDGEIEPEDGLGVRDRRPIQSPTVAERFHVSSSSSSSASTATYLCLSTSHVLSWSTHIAPVLMFLVIFVFLTVLLVAHTAGRILGLRRKNVEHRAELFSKLGVENGSAKKIVGFFHPYW